MSLKKRILLATVVLLNAVTAWADGGHNSRRPADDAELRYWLENMIVFHRFTAEEVTAATGLTTNEVAAAAKFHLQDRRAPWHIRGEPLLVLPYPGGRHPRIGFLEGAIDPQRETKFSVFTPWDPTSYVVVDVPEAIFSNLGLTYLAHTHVPTIWTSNHIELPRLEWNRHSDGSLESMRTLPDGMAFGAAVVPAHDGVRMSLWLKNGTGRALTDLRVQNCVMLKGAAGFADLTNTNKVFSAPYAAVHDTSGRRWWIVAWDPCDQTWGNERVPCLHSDPKFPDCAPGKTVMLAGWLSFYEGSDIQSEFRRLDQVSWRLPGAGSRPARPAGNSPPNVEPRLSKASRAEMQDVFDLLTDLVYVAPTQLQQEMTDRSFTLFSDWLSRTNEPALEVAQRLSSETRDLLKRVCRDFPSLRIGWRTNGAVLLADAPKVSLAEGLERVLLVEVTNEAPEAVQLSVTAAGTSRGGMRAIQIQPREARVFWTRLVGPARGLREAPLVLTPSDAAAARTVPIPIMVSAPALIRGRLLEGSTDEAFPGRVYVLGSDRVFHRDSRFGAQDTLSTKPLLQFLFQNLPKSYTFPFFYSDGSFEIKVPPGEARLTLERGFEHPLVTTNLSLAPGETRSVLHWAKNWWSQNEDIALLAIVQRAEDLRVANNLTLKHHVTTTNFIAPTQYPMGPIPGYCSEDWHMEMAEEYRNEEFFGHLIFLNLKKLVEPISTGSMGGPTYFDYPINKTAILEVRRQGGISIEAHGLGRNWDVPVNVVQDLTDSLDQIDAEDYYRFLDCGFQLPISNGSDHPARVVGCARVYVKTRLPFTYQNWIDGIRSNRTFTTSGPLLFLEVNGHEIGDVLRVKSDTVLTVKAHAASRLPLGNFQIVSNGKILAEKSTQNREAGLTVHLPSAESRWIVARCSPDQNFSAISGPNIAHTSAIYVLVDGKPRFVSGAAREWIKRMRVHAEDIARQGHFENDSQRNEAVGHVLAGIAAYERLLEKYASAPGHAADDLAPKSLEVDKPMKRP